MLAFIGNIGSTEMIVLAIIAVMLFGNRLPSIARSFGKSIIEFKKGMKDIENDVKSSIYDEPAGRVGYDDRSEPSGPRFEPPKAEEEEAEPQTAGASGKASDGE